MKKLISGILSVAVLATSMLGFASTAQAATTNITIPAGQRMTYIGESGSQYRVRLYTEQGNGKYAATTQVTVGTQTATATSGIIGYINKTDVDTTYFGGNYGRPWTNPYDSIVYGAKYIADGYLGSQYTLYFQKFNVVKDDNKNAQFSHEYMTNISGAAEEAKILYNGYKEANMLKSPHTFYIPVYSNITDDNGNYSTATYPEFTGKYAHDIEEFAKKYGGTNYTFKAINTGLNFDDAVAKEMNANPGVDKEKVKYYLNPLNFLTEEGIFQFESLKKEDCDKISPDANAPKNLVNGILKGSWMENKDITYTTTEGTTRTYTTGSGTTLKNATYTDAIVAASTTNGWGVNYIATKIRQENGVSYGSAITGTTAPFQGIYNFFNIGANITASDGLAFAAGYMKAKTNTTLYYTNATINQTQQTTTKPTTTTKNYTPAKVKLVSLTAQKSGHKIVVKWNKCTTSATGYQIVWARDKKFKKVVATKTITGRRYKSYTGKNFTKGRKYYVRVRAYKKAGGKTYYGAWSNIKAKTAK